LADEYQARVTRRKAGECGALLDGNLKTGQRQPSAEALLPRLEPGKLVIQLKLDYTKVISRIAGRRLCPGCSALADLAVAPLKKLGKCDRRREALKRREDDRENVMWDGLETCGGPPRRVLNYLVLSGRQSCGVDRSDWSPEPHTGRMSGCMVLE
jgi:adenylate kinase family enzyme